MGRFSRGTLISIMLLSAETKQVQNKAFIIHPGDNVGASLPVAALLQDEPGITFNCKAENKFNPECNVYLMAIFISMARFWMKILAEPYSLNLMLM